MNLYKVITLLKDRLFYSPIKCYRRRGMKIGTNCSITTWNLYSEAFLISIGNNVQITSGVKIFTHGAGWVLRNKYANYDAFGKVIIGNNVYIGNNAMIMPGITIGSNVVIAAGAVVTKNIPDGVVVGGNPAKIIETIENFEKKYIKYNMGCKFLSHDQKLDFLKKQPEELLLKLLELCLSKINEMIYLLNIGSLFLYYFILKLVKLKDAYRNNIFYLYFSFSYL